MTRFRALVAAGALALSFNFVGCFDHGNPCEFAAAAGTDGGGSDGTDIGKC